MPASEAVYPLSAAFKLALCLGSSAGLSLRNGEAELGLGRPIRSVLGRLNVEIELDGTPDPSVPLWVCNHVSWIDPLVLMSMRPMGVLAKAEIAHYPILGSVLRRAGIRFVSRKDPLSRASTLARMACELRVRTPFLLFPEGTTTDGSSLAPLQEGALRAAYRLGCEIQSIRIDSQDLHYPWLGDENLLPHLWKVALAGRTRVRLKAGPVLKPRNFADEEAWLLAVQSSLMPEGRGER